MPLTLFRPFTRLQHDRTTQIEPRTKPVVAPPHNALSARGNASSRPTLLLDTECRHKVVERSAKGVDGITDERRPLDDRGLLESLTPYDYFIGIWPLLGFDDVDALVVDERLSRSIEGIQVFLGSTEADLNGARCFTHGQGREE